MSKKNMFLLAAGYIIGGVVSSLYSKKKPGELKKKLEHSDNDFSLLVDNFISTHKNLIDDMKLKILTEENIKLFNNEKEEILNIIEVYKNKGTELIEDLKVKGKEYVVVASEELEKLYNEKKDEIESLKGITPEKIGELKEALLVSFKELKKEIKKIGK